MYDAEKGGINGMSATRSEKACENNRLVVKIQPRDDTRLLLTRPNEIDKRFVCEPARVSIRDSKIAPRHTMMVANVSLRIVRKKVGCVCLHVWNIPHPNPIAELTPRDID